MDMLKISSKFTTGIVSKILQKQIKKAIGCDAAIDIHEVKISMKDKTIHLHANFDGSIGTEDFMKMLSKNN